MICNGSDVTVNGARVEAAIAIGDDVVKGDVAVVVRARSKGDDASSTDVDGAVGDGNGLFAAGEVGSSDRGDRQSISLRIGVIEGEVKRSGG